MAIEYGPIKQYDITWGSNVIPDPAGRPVQEYVFPIAFAEACPVPNKVVKKMALKQPLTATRES